MACGGEMAIGVIADKPDGINCDIDLDEQHTVLSWLDDNAENNKCVVVNVRGELQLGSGDFGGSEFAFEAGDEIKIALNAQNGDVKFQKMIAGDDGENFTFHSICPNQSYRFVFVQA